jgi:drug/metabolite transporter (DMT)-like permease
MSHHLSKPTAVLLFAVVVLCWGINWPVTKMIVASVPPLWTTALRCAIAAVVLLALQLAQGNLIVPRLGDVPVVLGIALLHMVAFSALIATGLKFVPASRAIVLGYTTPLWVMPGALLFLREPLTRWRVLGIGLGLAGLLVMFNPLAFDWSDADALKGNACILLAALCWAVSILQVRGHRWVSTPFQLVFWEVLLAAVVLAALGYHIEGVPEVTWTPELLALLAYGGVLGTAVAYWAMAMVNRSLPAMTTSLGLLATPVVGTASAAYLLAEPITVQLVTAMTLIVMGIALGIIGDRAPETAAGSSVPQARTGE